jgi:hypothetical protein
MRSDPCSTRSFFGLLFALALPSYEGCGHDAVAPRADVQDAATFEGGIDSASGLGFTPVDVDGCDLLCETVFGAYFRVDYAQGSPVPTTFALAGTPSRPLDVHGGGSCFDDAGGPQDDGSPDSGESCAAWVIEELGSSGPFEVVVSAPGFAAETVTFTEPEAGCTCGNVAELTVTLYPLDAAVPADTGVDAPDGIGDQ